MTPEKYCADCAHWKTECVAEDRNWGAYLFIHECCLEHAPVWNEEEECMECENFTLYHEDSEGGRR